nr:YopX family protein [Streptococcus mitis]
MILKFRAWDKTRNEMNYRVMVGNCDTDDENWTCPTIWIEERKKWLHFDDYECIMQSTGLKDKNGKEIFEGDVVRQVRTQPTTENEIITGVVTMLEGAWLIMNDYEQLASVLWSETDENEIIGNVYENPELLEDKK